MTIFDALILSLVEGITEFLPVSSTGHLVLSAHLLGLEHTDFLKSFEVIIQLGAILAVFVLFWQKFFIIKKKKAFHFDNDMYYFVGNIGINNKVWSRVLLAFIPTAIIGFTLYDLIKNVLIGNELITVLALLFGGIALIVLEKILSKRHTLKSFEDSKKEIDSKSLTEKIESLSTWQSIGIGLAQSLSIIPGVSRSAASILGGMFLGAHRKTAVEFSFLLAIPTMVAATTLDLLETNFELTANEWTLLTVGFSGSFIVALIVVKWFVKYVQTNTFIPFGIYRIVIAALYWLLIIY